MNTSDFQDIAYHCDEQGVVKLTLNTPARRNALSMYSFHEIYHAIDNFEKDTNAHAMIITGAVGDRNDPSKEAYSSGGYFSRDAYAGLSEDVLSEMDFKDIAQKRTTMKMVNCDKPIIAAINGMAIGGAVTLTLAGADQIYMSEYAWLQLPFAKLGISAELASSYLLPRLLGMQKAKEIMFFAEPIDAHQAKALRLANEVLPHDELLDFAYQRASELIPPKGAPRSIAAIKGLLREAQIPAMEEALDRENIALASLFESADFAEAIAARAERRAPNFTGA